jgi:malate synthase
MTTTGVDLRGAMEPGFDEVLTTDALAFLEELQRRFGPTREKLLRARAKRRQRLAEGGALAFLEETRDVRESDWQVTPRRLTCSSGGWRSRGRPSARWPSTR